MKSFSSFSKCASVLLAAVALSPLAGATTIGDLTTEGAVATINGAIFEQIDPQSTGTGVIDSFVQIQSNGTEEAYNTTVNNTLDNGSSNNFNHSIVVGDVPIVDIDGTLYREFLLDINEVNSQGENFLSLDEVQIFVGGTANSSVETFTGGILDHDGTLIYDLDGDGMDNWLALNYDLNAGSGSGDMFMYIPDALFSGFADDDVVTLYSAFGLQGEVSANGVPAGDYGSSDGFEEWAVLRDGEMPVIPEPATVSLLLMGLAGGAISRYRRTKF